MYYFEKNKRTEGITLIALVVSIIVLLILAGISISMLSGDNSLLSKTSEAKEKTQNASINEQRQLAMLSAATNLNGTEYNGVKIPAGFAPTEIDGENSTNDGLVIIDANGNEFVWIEVPKTTSIYTISGLDIQNFNDDEYDNIENDLKSYANLYRNESIYKDDYPTEIIEDVLGITSTEYENLKKKMLYSIYTNGGFWIGRYEAGIEENRIAKGNIDDNLIPLSQANKYPLTYITCKQAQLLANRQISYKSEYTSSLMFGIQWDLAMKYLETALINNGGSISSIQEQIIGTSTGSIDWGNYYNSTFQINRGNYAKYGEDSIWHNYMSSLENLVNIENNRSIKLSTSDTKESVLLTTGSSDRNKKQNIYDLAR